MNDQPEKTTQATLQSLRPVNEKIESLPTISVGLTSLQGFELVQRAAKCLAASSLVPKEYQNNISNCVVALNMAARVGADPLMVMQNLVIVHGRPTWSSQFMIATVNSCGRFTALRYEFFGKPGTDEWGCRAWAMEKATGEKLVGTDVTIKLAKDEGWYGKSGSKWKTIPQQMLMYRAGSWWARAYAPELSMGLHTADEAHDVYDAEKQPDGSYKVNMEALRDANAAGVVVDQETGEIKSDIAAQNAAAATSTADDLPPALKNQPLPADFADKFMDQIKKAVNLQELQALRKDNASLLHKLSQESADSHTLCNDCYEDRKIELAAQAGKAAA